MSNRFMTDGAGQEVCAQMDKVIARFNGDTPSDVSSEAYDSKDFLSEETGRTLASKVASLSDAVGGYIQRSDVKAVLYDEAQSLTEEQQAQARENIGAIAADEAQVPVASQTQFGTVKVYTDSEGYLCIDTE